MPLPLIAAGIMAGASIAGGIMGMNAANANKKAVRKAARKNYNTMMNNARMMEKSVYENMATYQRDAAEYKSSMVAARSAMGGVRTVNDNEVQKEVLDYEFGIDKIDYEKNAYKDPEGTTWMHFNSDNGGIGYEYVASTEYAKHEADAKVDDKNNEALYNSLMNYKGRQATFTTPSTSALAVEQESIKELQTDLNRTYVQGMTEVLQQRQQAQNAWQSMETQAQMYQIQGMQSLWNGLLGAGTTMASAFGQMGSNKTSAAPKIYNGGGVAARQYASKLY